MRSYQGFISSNSARSGDRMHLQAQLGGLELQAHVGPACLDPRRAGDWPAHWPRSACSARRSPSPCGRGLRTRRSAGTSRCLRPGAGCDRSRPSALATRGIQPLRLMPSRWRAISRGPTRISRRLSMAVCAVESSTLAASMHSERSAPMRAGSIVAPKCTSRTPEAACVGLKLRDGGSRHRARRVVVDLRGMAPEDLREQWILGWRCRAGHPVDACHWARVQRARCDSPCGKRSTSGSSPRSLSAITSSSMKVPWLTMICRYQGSVIGKVRSRSTWTYGAALAQVRQPGLTIVRVGRQQRVAERPPARIRFVAGPLPGGHALGRIVGRACRRSMRIRCRPCRRRPAG